MWSYDLAREQCPNRDHLFEIAAMTADAGYNALGLYVEHRFAFPSVPWIRGTGALSPENVRALESEFPSLQFIPMINLLGHMEGFLYTEWGKQFREEMFRGMQACPSNPEFVALCQALVRDTIACFSSEIIHLGGDETQQLGRCPLCKARAEQEGVEGLWGEHFGALARQVLASGRRPAAWGDMLLSHPKALPYLPKETLIFDWEYHEGVAETSSVFVREGFEVVACPSLQTFNAPWLHVPESTHNIAKVVEDAWSMGLYGVCLTTWECGLMGAYDTLFPAIRAVGNAVREFDPSRDGEPPIMSKMYELLERKENLDKSGRVESLSDKQSPEIVIKQYDLLNFSTVELNQVTIDRETLKLVPAEMAWRLQVVPFKREGNELWLAMADHKNEAARDEVWIETSCRIHPVYANHLDVFQAIARHYDRPNLGPILNKALYESYDRGNSAEWMRLMGTTLQSAGGPFAYGRRRDSLKSRLLMQSNPFLAWLHHGEELSGECGDKALAICEQALHVAPGEAERGVTLFVRNAIDFVRLAEEARVLYATENEAKAISKLAIARTLFDELAKIARRTHTRIGGSLADVDRCIKARDHVERVIVRLRDYGNGSLGYLPAWEHLTHPKFIPHDQGAWWKINQWADE